MKKTELLFLEPIQDLIELILWTCYIKFENPVSITIIAEPESGKTEIVKKYRRNNGVHATRKFTAYGILRDLIEGKIHLLFDKLKILGHIVVFDFGALGDYKPSTENSTISFCDAITEDGLEVESSYAIDPEKLKPFRGLKGGIIACMNILGFFTSDNKKRIKASMRKGGWFSRNIIVSYDISDSEVKKIFKSIRKGKYRPNKNFVSFIAVDFPKKRVNVDISERMCEEIETIVDDIKEDLRDYFHRSTIKGIRLYKRLIALAKASALRDGRRKVKQKDIERLKYLSNWMNLRFNRLPKTKYPFAW